MSMIISYEDTQKFLTDVTFDDIKDLDGKLSKFNFVSLVELPQEYSALLYLVIIDKPDQNKYFGFDTKGFDGTYIGSPVTNEKQFKKDIAGHDWRCICVDYGNVGVMAALILSCGVLVFLHRCHWALDSLSMPSRSA